MVGVQHFFQRFLVDLLVAVVEFEVLISVVLELVEVGVAVLVNVGIAEEIQMVTKLFLYVINLSLGVLLGCDIELAGRCLESICLRCAATLGYDLVDAALNVRALDIVNLQQVLEDAFIRRFRLVYKVLIANDVDGVQL